MIYDKKIRPNKTDRRRRTSASKNFGKRKALNVVLDTPKQTSLTEIALKYQNFIKTGISQEGYHKNTPWYQSG